MQCIHFVKIKPFLVGDEYWSLEFHKKWLKENGIDRYRLSTDPWYQFNDTGYVLFRFAEPEDAMAFKLRWESEGDIL